MEGKLIRLFVDGHVFDREYQGAQTFLRELYNHLLVCHPELDIYIGAQDVDNIKSIFPAVPVNNILPYQKRRAGILRYLFDIPKYIKKYRFDFAHFQYIVPGKIRGCRYIVTMHDVLFDDFKKEFSFFFRLSRHLIFGRSIREADIRTTVSEYSKQQICTHYHIPENTIHVIPNGVREEAEQTKTTRQDAMDLVEKKFGIKDFILNISRIEPRKNQLLLLSKYLALNIHMREIALVFVGQKSAHVPGLTRLIEGLDDNQKKYLHWLPQADPADLTALYRACRLFVYPSKAEGFGIPPLEAAVGHAPVLCSSATAMKEFSFFEPHTFDPTDDEEFEQKLSQIIDMPPTESFRQKVAEHVKQYYDWKDSSERFYQLLFPNP